MNRFCSCMEPVLASQAISSKGKYWSPGEVIDIYISPDFSEYERHVIVEAGSDWLKPGHGYKGANLVFNFNAKKEESDVRIGKKYKGLWSMVGTDCLMDESKSEWTMNLEYVEPSDVRHEFGHMMNMLHVHKSPGVDNKLDWITEVVYKDLGGPPNNWSKFRINFNVIDRYDPSVVDFGEMDWESIMLYFFPGTWVKSGVGTKRNQVLSKGDKKWTEGRYPFPQEEKEIMDALQAMAILFPSKKHLGKKPLVKNMKSLMEFLGETNIPKSRRRNVAINALWPLIKG